MATTADYITFDVYDHPPGGPWLWSRRVKEALQQSIPGMRAITVNHSNHLTHSFSPKSLLPPGRALFAAWDSREAALAAFRGPLAVAVEGTNRYSLDGEVARVRLERPDHNWHGWNPSDEGAEPILSDEPMVVVVHGIIKKGELLRFVRNSIHAGSQAKFHPGHRGSVDVSSQLPHEQTSISLWKTAKLARDYAYKPGGHLHAMNDTRATESHRVGVFLQIRVLASSGALGLDTPAFPDMPPAIRA